MMTIKEYNFRVHIHMGAHKTASTFLQNWLAKNRNFLRDNQIAYVPLETLRRSFTAEFCKLVLEKEKITPIMAARLREILFAEVHACGFDLESTHLLVVSEENVLGSMAALSTKGVLYPGLHDRMRLLAYVFAGYDVQPFLALRNYNEFYPSAYAETLRKGYLKRFENYMSGLSLIDNSWIDVVASIESAMGSARLWAYEQFRHNVHVILSELLQLSITPDMINVDTVVRKSLTQKGLNIVMKSKDSLSVTETKRLINLLAEKMQFDAPDEKIAIKDIKTVAFLNDKYRNDLEQLSGRFIMTAPT